jgi:glutathione peroxidase
VGLKQSCTFDAVATSTPIDSSVITEAKAILCVNTASLCGYTPQLAQMQQLHERFHAKGLVVIAIPSNDFGEQEPWEEDKVKEFYEKEHGVSFQISTKQHVIGGDAHPLFCALAAEFGEYITPDWNFAKYLINAEGELVGFYRPEVEPTTAEVIAGIEDALK